MKTCGTPQKVHRLRTALVALASVMAVLPAALIAAPPAAAQTDLTAAVINIDIASFPQVSAVVHLGGLAAIRAGELPPEAFTVLVNGTAVVQHSVRAISSEPLPSATILLIDESGSMRGPAVSAAAAAARRFVEAMRPGDTVAIQAFNEDFRELHGFSSDKAALSASLDSLKPTKETALYDALLQSMDVLGKAPDSASRFLVLLSDGGDTASKASLDDVLARVRASGAQVYTVGLQTKEFDAKPLSAIAEATGARYLETPNLQALGDLYASLAREIQNQYLVTFSLPENSRGKGAGELAIKVVAAGNVAEGARGFFYPEAVVEATVPSTSPVTAVPPLVERTSADSVLLRGFVTWGGSSYVVTLLVFTLLLLALYALSGILFPKRNVLAEYDDILQHRRNLGPRPTAGSEQTRPGERLVGGFLTRRGYQGPLQRRIEDAGWPLRTSEFVLIHLSLIVLTVVALALVGVSLLAAAVVVLLVVIAPLVYLDHKAKKRRAAFEAQVPDTLIMLASSLRAGQGLEQALLVVAEEGPDPTATEFRRLLAQQRLGVAPEDTLRTLADRMGSQAFDWVVMATIIQRQVGGNLAEIYEKTAETLRGREMLRREVQTLTAEGRLSAVVLVVLPFVVAGAELVINPEYELLLVRTDAGRIIVGGAVGLILVGIIWIRRIIQFDI